jgi:hypothetical protein
VLAVIRDPVRRLIAGTRLDWMSQVVRAGRLPDWLREQLAEAQQVAATAYIGVKRLPDHEYRLGFSAEQTQLITWALRRVRQEQPSAPDGSTGNRDPPGLRGDESLFVFPAEGLATELRGRVSEREAADLVERLVTVAWHDGDGLVIAMSEDRFAELERLGALEPVIDGARSRAPPPPTEPGTDDPPRRHRSGDPPLS